MARQVAVDLTLDAGPYLAESRAVKSETASVDRELDQLDRSIDKVDRDMAELAATSKIAARQMDDLGDQSRGSAAAMTALDARIKATRLSVRELGLEFGRTGDKADGQAVSREQSLLSRLERLKKTLGKIAPDGSEIPSAASIGLGGGRLATNPYVLAGAGTAIAVAGPALGAMLGGIVAGAIGTVGVAGGLLMASKDPKVLGVARGFGDAISAEFFRGGDAFVKPAIESMGILEQDFREMHVPEAFAQVAPQVTVIADGIGELGKNLMPGFNAALGRMGPFADAAHDGMADLGKSLGTFLDDVTASPGAVLGLRFAFGVLDSTVVVLGKEIRFLSDAFGGMLAIGAKLGQSGIIKVLSGGLSDKPSKQMQDAIDAFSHINTAAAGASNGIGLYTAAADGATNATKGLNAQVTTAYDNFLLLEGDEVAAQAAIDDLADSLKTNGQTFDENTAAGRANVSALIAVARTATTTVTDMVAHGKSIDEVSAKYNEYRTELLDAAIQAGATADQAQILVDKWLALSNLDNIVKSLTIMIYTHGSQGVAYDNGSDNPFLKGYASGGTTPAFEPFKVGERGEEWMFDSKQHFVATKAMMAQQWNGSVGGGGGSETRHVVDLHVNGKLLRSLLITEALNRNQSQSTVRAAYP